MTKIMIIGTPEGMMKNLLLHEGIVDGFIVCDSGRIEVVEFKLEIAYGINARPELESFRIFHDKNAHRKPLPFRSIPVPKKIGNGKGRFK